MSSAITFQALAGVLSMDTRGWTQGLQRGQSDLAKFRQNANALFSQVAAGAKKVEMAVGAIATAATAMTAQSVRVGASFEQSMSKVAAISGATGVEFDKLQAKAREMGATTVYSATQAAEAMQFFSLAGFQVNEILEAMQPTLNLAAAGNLQIAEAADITAKVMRGMGIEAKDLTEVTDVLVKAFTTSNTNLQQLGEAMKYVGPIARTTGNSLNQTIAPLQIMSDAGIQASMAGTSLRGILIRLSADARETVKVFDSLGIAIRDEVTGRVRPLPDLIDEFNAAVERLGPSVDKAGLASVAFGQRAGPAFAALLEEGGAKLREYERRLEDAGGTAKRIADTQLDNLAGSLTILTSVIESVQIAVSEKLNPGIRKIVDRMAQWLSANEELIASGVDRFITGLTQGVVRFSESFMRLWGVVSPILVGLQERFAHLFETASQWFAALPQWQQDVLIVAGGLLFLSNVLGGLGAAIPIVGGVFTAISALLNPIGLLKGSLTAASSLWGMFSSAASMAGTAVAGAAASAVAAAATISPASATAAVAVTAVATAASVAGTSFNDMAIDAEFAVANMARLAIASNATALSLLHASGASQGMSTSLMRIGGDVKTVDSSFTNWAIGASAATDFVDGKIVKTGGLWSRIVGGMRVAALGLVGVLKGALAGAFAVLTSPITLVVAAIAAVSAATVYAVKVSKDARANIMAAWEAVSGAVTSHLSGAFSLLQDWWRDNGDSVKQLAVQLGELTAFLINVFAHVIANIATVVGPLFVESLKSIGNVLGFVVNVLSMVASILTGDFRGAWASAVEAMANFLDFSTKLIQWIPGVGDAIKGVVQDMRDYAKETREAEKATRDLGKAEVANATARSQPSATPDELADVDVSGDLSDDEMFWRIYNQRMMQLEQEEKEKERQQKAKEHEKRYADVAERVDAMFAKPEVATQDESAPSEISHDEVKARAEELLRAEAEEERRRELDQRAREQAGMNSAPGAGLPSMPFEMPSMPAVGGPPAPPSMAGQAGASEMGSAKQARPPVAALDPDAVGELWGTRLAAATRDQSLSMFDRLKDDLMKSLRPDQDGIVSTSDVETIFQNYFAVLSRMPDFSAEQFAEIKEQVFNALEGIEQAGTEMHGFYMEALESTLGTGQEVFVERVEETRDVIAEWMEFTGSEIQQRTAMARQWLDAQIADARKRGASMADLRELAAGRQKILAMMRDVAKSHGEARKTAVEELRTTVEAYQDNYNKIVGIVEESSKEIVETTKTTAEEVAAVQQAGQQGAMAEVVGANGGGGMSMIGGMMNQVMGLGNELSTMFMGVTSGIFAANAQFARFAQTITDPLAQIDLQIQNINARMQQAQLNRRFGGNAQQIKALQDEMNQLGQRRQAMVAERASDAERAEQMATEEAKRRDAEKSNRDRESRRELGLDLASAIGVGQQQPMQIVINGVNDIREAYDRMEKEARRRGYRTDGRGGLRN